MKLISRKQYGTLAGLLLAATVASPALVQGQIVVYNFNSTATPLAASTVGSGISAGDITFNSVTGYSWFWTEPAGSGALELHAGVTDNTPAQAIAASMYFSFTLSSATPMNLSSLTVDGGYGNFSNPAGYALQSSVDGYSSIIASGDFAPNLPAFATDTANLSGAAFQGLTSITFRVLGYNAPYGYLQFDNITVNSAAVPEPGLLALAGMGIAGLMALRRRN
jgi:hypothetical protein